MVPYATTLRYLSLPSRERGLKYVKHIHDAEREGVAPLAGAWVEIVRDEMGGIPGSSLPSRERGLKSFFRKSGTNVFRRSPRGSVG